MHFPARVDAPAAGRGVGVVKGEMRPDASEADTGDEASKLNLNLDDRDGVEDTCPTAGDGGKVALPRKPMLSTDTWNRVACPSVSVSMSSRKPSTEIYVLLDGIGFLFRYLFELRSACTGRIDSVRLFL